jgi:hypothetical protein
MVLANDSTVLYQGKKIQMEKGRMLVTAQPGAEVRFAKLTITPQGPAKFQVGQTGSTLAVAAFEGSLNVTDGIHNTVLPSGQMMTRAAEEREFCNPESKEYDKRKCGREFCNPKSKEYDKTKCAAANDQQQGSGSSSSSSSSGSSASGTTATASAGVPGWVKGVVVVGAVGGAVGGAAAAGAFNGSSKPASTSTP